MFRHEHISIGPVDIYLIHYDSFDPHGHRSLLSESEQARLDGFHHVKRQREYVSTRILKHELFGFKPIEYNEHGAPFIQKEGFISISHSEGCSAIAVCSSFQIGLDLEPIDTKAMRLCEKFVNAHEKTFLNCADPLEMTMAWSCKETLYKLAGRKKIIFKSDLLLLGRSEAHWQGRIVNPGQTINVELTTIVLPQRVITLNTKPCEYIEHT